MQIRLLKTLLLGLPLLITGGCKEYFVEQLAFLPERASHYPPSQFSNTQEIWLSSHNELRIHGFYLSNTDSDKVVLFFHGNAGNVFSRLNHADRIRNMGLNVLLIDYQGYGKSEGKPSELGVYQDAETAYQYALNELGFMTDNIYVYGRSIGSTAAIDLATNHNIAKTVLIAPLQSGRAMAKEMGFGWLDFLVKGVFDNYEKSKQIVSPVLIIHGEQDRIVPVEQGQALYEAFVSKNKRLIRASDMGHNDLSNSEDIDFWSEIESFYMQ